MIALYASLTWLAYLLIYPYGYFRAKRENLVWQGRFALGATLQKCDIWLHASSVGEIKVIANLIAELSRIQPSLVMHVTVMTQTGYAEAEKLIGSKVSHSYFPLDAPQIMKRMFASLNPKMFVVAETEIWPNLICEAKSRRIPIVLVNGRMSERAFKKYRLIRKSMQKLLATYQYLFFKTTADSQRYAAFGLPSDKMLVAGDMKFDTPVAQRDVTRRKEIREKLLIADNEFLLAAGSTRAGEENILLEIYCELKAEWPRLRLLLTPRHIERTKEIVGLLNSQQLSFTIYPVIKTDADSEATHTDAEKVETDVIVINVMGMLNDLYLAADIAFVGGTLVPIGGHNLLEPVWNGTPVLFGPSISNVIEAADYIQTYNFGAQVDSSGQLREVLDSVLSGTRTFSRKTESNSVTSSTHTIATYILGHLNHA
ncbi:MAG: glycosyltransferase N-terminal domain-containing protein [candidate division Zixibacteria bacterium]|nr:glycosyltransferase N-terminal domain-containing protein [candidate division Zixibacteria bacterium]